MKLLLLFFPVIAFAQSYNLGVIYTNVDPVNPCTIRSTLVSNYANGKVWMCNAGTYLDITGGGSGSVTSVAATFTGGIVSIAGSPITSSGVFALTVAGTSGGIPYFSSSSTWATSAALTANLPVIGGGAGSAPSVGTRSGNTTKFVTTTGTQTSGDCVKIDANGNHIANGSSCGSGGTGYGVVCSNYVATSESTNSTTFTDLATVDGCSFTLSGTTTIAVHYTAWCNNLNANTGDYSNVTNVDGTDDAGSEYIVAPSGNTDGNSSCVEGFGTSLAAGAHTIKIRHKVYGSVTGKWVARQLIVWASP